MEPKVVRKLICFRSRDMLHVQYAFCHYAGEMRLLDKPLKQFPLSKWKDAQAYTVKRAKKEGYMFWLKWDFRKEVS